MESHDRFDGCLFIEELTSARTTALFALLMLLFSGLFIWRMVLTGFGALSGVFLFFACIFLFYTVNFRRLVIRLTRNSLTLRFGLFSWEVPLERVGKCRVDELPAFLKYGGAGIHFMTVCGRYRVNFNFLEYPRVVASLKTPAGMVKDVSFSTRRPEVWTRLVQEAAGLDL